MKLRQLIKQVTGFSMALAMVAGILMFATPALAVPYTGDSTPPLASPAFNQYTGVPSIGDESDFLRGREVGIGDYVNNLPSNCTNGQEFSLRVYVHNGASQHENGNGDGPSVAHNTNVKVMLPGASAASNFPIGANISSSNAGSVSDDMTITCANGKQVKMSYVTGSAVQVNALSGTQALSDSIVTSSGAPIGTMSPNGDVWGCWDQRVYVYLKVKVADVPPEPPVKDAVCKAVDVKAYDNRRVTATVNGSVTNGQIIGYEINWGDGSKSTSQTAEHTYAADGTYNIVTRVQVRFNDGEVRWVTASACNAQVTFKPGVPPTVVVTPPTPTTLPDTGAGSLMGIFAATSVAGTLAYRLVWARRYQ